MKFRCTDCRSDTWLGRSTPVAASESVACGHCGRSYTVQPAPELGSTVGDHYRHTLQLAKSRQIDMSAAYSILLGLISLEESQILQGLDVGVSHVAAGKFQVAVADGEQPELDPEELWLLDDLEIQDPNLGPEELRILERLETLEAGSECEAAPLLEKLESAAGDFDADLQQLLDNLEEDEPDLDEAERRVRRELVAPPEFDPDFEKSVARGRMTIQEALRRGDRTIYANNLAERHGLPKSLAYAVADNRVSLYRARVHHATVRARRQPKPGPKNRTSPGRRLATRVVAVVAVLFLGGVIWFQNFRLSERRDPPSASHDSPAEPRDPLSEIGPVPAPSVALSSARVETNDMGHVTRVVGASADAVLNAYCRAQPEIATHEALRITETVPASPVARLGLLRNLDSTGPTMAIRIRLDRAIGSWVAGDGVKAIPLLDAP